LKFIIFPPVACPCRHCFLHAITPYCCRHAAATPDRRLPVHGCLSVIAHHSYRIGWFTPLASPISSLTTPLPPHFRSARIITTLPARCSSSIAGRHARHASSRPLSSRPIRYFHMAPNFRHHWLPAHHAQDARRKLPRHVHFAIFIFRHAAI